MAGCTAQRAKQKKEGGGGGECEDDGSSCVFPTARVRRLIGEGGGGENSFRVTNEAVFLINKASEMFLQSFTKDAYLSSSTKGKSKNKSLMYDHLSSLVCNEKRYEFLSDFVPEKVRAEDALKEWEVVET